MKLYLQFARSQNSKT